MFSGRQVQANLAQSGRTANFSSREPSAKELVPTLRVLLNSALSLNTWKIYQRAWATFNEFHRKFYHSFDPVLPLTTPSLALFISYLHACKLALSTIKSYLSAISCVHEMKGVRDPTKAFLYRQVVNSPRSSGIKWHKITTFKASATRAHWFTTANQLFRLSAHPYPSYVVNGFLWLLLSHRWASGQEQECWGFSSSIK